VKLPTGGPLIRWAQGQRMDAMQIRGIISEMTSGGQCGFFPEHHANQDQSRDKHTPGDTSPPPHLHPDVQLFPCYSAWGGGKRMSAQSLRPINLFRGWPHPSLLASAAIRSAASEALSDPEIITAGLLYGPDWGFEPLRENIASWLTGFYEPEQAITRERLVVTGGASQNLACILQAYSDPIYTRNVWMVSPTYFLACRIFEDAGFHKRLRAVPEDDQGVDIEYLKKGLEESEEEARKSNNDELVQPPSSHHLF
jgi:DNA-binding transcriptional MocR family regulator